MLKTNYDVLLIRPPTSEAARRTLGADIPLELACLSAYLSGNNITNKILDMQVERDPFKLLTNELEHCSFKAAGLTAYSINLNQAHNVAKFIKDSNKNVKIILGGVAASVLSGKIMQNFEFFDQLVFGEGEITFFELVREAIEGNIKIDIAGSLVRIGTDIIVNAPRQRIEDLDSLPFPARDKLNLNKYSVNYSNKLQGRSTAMITSRGCPNGCNFCSSGSVWNGRVVYQSAQRLAAEIMHCKERYAIKDFHFHDDVFTVNRQRVVDFCDLLLKNKVSIHWNCFSHINSVDAGLLKIMRESGCYQIKYGIEVGSEKSLKICGKNNDPQKAKEVVMLTRKAGIECLSTFIMGLPGEQEHDCRKTISFAKQLCPDIAIFNIFDPLPGSKIFNELLARQADNFDWAKYFKSPEYMRQVIGQQRLDIKTLKSLLRHAYISYYLSIRWVSNHIKSLFIKRPARSPQILRGIRSLIYKVIYAYY